MKTKCTLVLLVLALSVCQPNVVAAQVNVQDSLALVALYNSTDGSHWKRHINWLTAAPVSTWFGVIISGDRVVHLSLRRNKLGGSIPPQLGDLTGLSQLILDDNNLTGTIPPELGNLTYLEYFYLYNNQLSGNIPPELGKLTNLINLSFRVNQLTGSIPAELGNLTNLVSLSLRVNRLTGSIPPELGKLKKLQILWLFDNHLTGIIPLELGNLKKLQDLRLYNNQLSGIIPKELGNITNLHYLFLDSNQLNGSIPPELGKLGLRNLYLNNNQLSGSIPRKLGNLKYLDVLNLSNNQLSGSIPSELGNPTYLGYLYLDSNQLSGTIPESFGDLKHLQVLSLSHNKLRGKIPASFSQLTKLQKLYLRDNQLRDTVPAFLASLPNLVKLTVQWNHFTFDGLETPGLYNIRGFWYGFQKKININQTNNTLSVNAGGTLSNNTYKWFNDGVLAATINGDSTFTPIASGNYSAEVTNSIATDLTLKSDTVSFSAFTTVAQNDNAAVKQADKNDFSVYPNPAKANVTVSFNTTGTYTIKLIDINGKVLQTKTGVAINNKNTVQLNVSKYATGIYFVTVSSEKNETQVLKLNKQ